MIVFGFRFRFILVFVLLVHFLPGAENARAHEGWGLVVDRHGQIFFSDIPTNTIWKVTREGRPEAFLVNKHSHALILGEDGMIYGTQEHHAAAVGSVWRIAPDGSGLTSVLTPSPDFPLNLHPFIIDRDGNIYSTNAISFPNQRDKVMLLKSTPGGVVTKLAGGQAGFRDGRGGEAQFSGIDGMAWARDGSLYVADGVYVRRVTMDGVVTTIGGALTSPVFGEDLMGLTVSQTGDILVADYSQHRVLRLWPDEAGSTPQTVLETGMIWSPTGIALAGEDIYVLEHLRMPLVILGDLGIGAYARVRKISPDGTVVSIATVWGRNTLTFVIVLLALLAGLAFLWRYRRRRRKRRAGANVE